MDCLRCSDPTCKCQHKDMFDKLDMSDERGMEIPELKIDDDISLNPEDLHIDIQDTDAFLSKMPSSGRIQLE